MVTVHPINAQVARRVREAIEQSGLKKSFILTKTGLAQVTLDRKLGGIHGFKSEELVLIAECIGVEPGSFFADFARAAEVSA